jgi:hypothetical protein
MAGEAVGDWPDAFGVKIDMSLTFRVKAPLGGPWQGQSYVTILLDRRDMLHRAADRL